MTTPKTYGEIRRELDRQGHSATDDLLPCSFCGTATKRATLANLGARCEQCYDQYVRLGYSGSRPPEQATQSEWVKRRAAEVRAYLAARGGSTTPNAFADLRRALPTPKPRLSEDEVNDLLQGAHQ